jgi:hypothetical protein
VINNYTGIGMTRFIIMAFLGIFPTALVYGELRLKTNSLWPAYLAHNVTNAISAQLIIEGFVKFNPNAEFIFSPGNEGINMMVFFWAIGLWLLYRQKSKHNFIQPKEKSSKPTMMYIRLPIINYLPTIKHDLRRF